MHQKCCALWDGQFCGSGKPGTDFKGVIFDFSSGNKELKIQWLNPFVEFVGLLAKWSDIVLFINLIIKPPILATLSNKKYSWKKIYSIIKLSIQQV